jgi:hypothetical protein
LMSPLIDRPDGPQLAGLIALAERLLLHRRYTSIRCCKQVL